MKSLQDLSLSASFCAVSAADLSGTGLGVYGLLPRVLMVNPMVIICVAREPQSQAMSQHLVVSSSLA